MSREYIAAEHFNDERGKSLCMHTAFDSPSREAFSTFTYEGSNVGIYNNEEELRLAFMSSLPTNCRGGITHVYAHVDAGTLIVSSLFDRSDRCKVDQIDCLY